MKTQTRFLIRGVGIGMIITAALFYFFISSSKPIVLPDQTGRAIEKERNLDA